jgi:hypothetical protein
MLYGPVYSINEVPRIVKTRQKVEWWLPGAERNEKGELLFNG